MEFNEVRFMKIKNAWIVSYSHRSGTDAQGEARYVSESFAIPELKLAAEWLLSALPVIPQPPQEAPTTTQDEGDA